jgi:hypothetical protein
VGSGTATLQAVLVSGNQSQGGIDSQQNTTGNGLGGGVYVDPSATANVEYLSQACARYLMRVGLPEPVTPEWEAKAP